MLYTRSPKKKWHGNLKCILAEHKWSFIRKSRTVITKSPYRVITIITVITTTTKPLHGLLFIEGPTADSFTYRGLAHTDGQENTETKACFQSSRQYILPKSYLERKVISQRCTNKD